MAPTAFFTAADDGRLHPTVFSASLWAPDTLHGPAVCGVAARYAETEFSRAGFRPARFTIDLFKAARAVPTGAVGRIVRDGGRIRVVEVDVTQFDDAPQGGTEPVVVARATVVFVREAQNPPGLRWQRPSSHLAGPALPADDLNSYYLDPDDPESQWTPSMKGLQAPVRKRLWAAGVPIVGGEEPTAFQRAVVVAEATSLVGNWGSSGIGFINCDLTVVLARLPQDTRIVVETDSHVESDGISASTATLHDSLGQFGTGMVTALNNAAAEIDFTSVEPRERFAQR